MRNQELQEATQKGDLDQAFLVRDHIREIEASEIVPPTSEGNGFSGHLAHRAVPTNGVLGRWRCANGVDIANFPAGRMSGNGTRLRVRDDMADYLISVETRLVAAVRTWLDQSHSNTTDASVATDDIRSLLEPFIGGIRWR